MTPNNSTEEEIDKDLEHGRFYNICSNEQNFKRYVLKIVQKRESLAYNKGREDTLKDLMKVADEGEIEDLRREVERYAKLNNITL